MGFPPQRDLRCHLSISQDGVLVTTAQRLKTLAASLSHPGRGTILPDFPPQRDFQCHLFPSREGVLVAPHRVSLCHRCLSEKEPCYELPSPKGFPSSLLLILRRWTSAQRVNSICLYVTARQRGHITRFFPVVTCFNKPCKQWRCHDGNNRSILIDFSRPQNV